MVVLNRSSLVEHSIFVPIIQLISSPSSALAAIHQKYGDLVSVGFFNSKLLFVCRPEHIEEIYTLEAKGLFSRDFLYEAKKLLFGNGLVNSKKDLWVKQRRIMQPIFTREAIATWTHIFTEEADSIVAQFLKSETTKINLSSELRILIQKIFIRILFGKTVDAIDNTDELIKSLGAITSGLGPHLVTEVIGQGKLKLLFPIQIWRLRKAIRLLICFVNQQIKCKTQQPGHDLISLLLHASDKKSGHSMTQALLRDEAMNLFFAGQDTTINALTWFFYLISIHPHVQQRITEEIQQHQSDPVTQETISKLIYTKATLHETLRLYPPSAGLATQALEDIEIGGQYISKGTAVILSIYATHRHDKLWERPNEFYPEHFLKASTTERHKYAFLPFGGGMHNCIGRHFAELEMMIIIVSLLRAFTLSTDGTVKAAPGITLKPDRDVIVALTPLFP